MKKKFVVVSAILAMFTEITDGAAVDNPHMVKQVTIVLQQLGKDESQVLPISGSGSGLDPVYFSICLDRDSGFGVLVGASGSNCITYNQEYGQLELTGKYQVVDYEQESDQLSRAFLAYHSDVNQGFWQQQPKGVCYVPSQNSSTSQEPFCLRGEKGRDSSKDSPAASAADYTMLVIIGAVLIYALAGAAYYSGCFQCFCREFCIDA